MKKFKILLLTGILITTLTSALMASDYVYTYQPPDPDLADLDHYDAYSWKIDVSDINENETITGASLFFDYIGNWDSSANKLHVSLIDTPQEITSLKRSYYTGSGWSGWRTSSTPFGDKDLFRYEDNQASGDLFASHGYEELFRIENMGETRRDVEISITDLDSEYYDYMRDELSWVNEDPNLRDGTKIHMPTGRLTNLITYASDGIFGLGFDPDCHFWNYGITLKLTTEPTPPNVVPEPEALLLFGIGLLGVSAFGRRRLSTGGNLT